MEEQEQEAKGYWKTGSTLLDLALGGGIAKDRLTNILGDSSTGKSLISLEILANAHKESPKTKLYLFDSEGTTMPDFVRSLGIDPGIYEYFSNDVCNTLEGFHIEIEKIASLDGEKIVILDSLDAMSVESEADESLDRGYNTGKAKLMSSLLRRFNPRLSQGHITLVILSQTRDNLASTAMFKPVHRSGGRALTFYSSQVILLKNKGKVTMQRLGNTSMIGVNVEAEVTKNKVAPPGRKCQFTIVYQHGILDVKSCVKYLIKEISDQARKKFVENWVKDIPIHKLVLMKKKEREELEARVIPLAIKVWNELNIEPLKDIDPKY